jgi:hypothetical protein
VFSLFEDYAFDGDTEQIAVRLSPEGYAFFRAWLRRQSDLVRTGHNLRTAPHQLFGLLDLVMALAAAFDEA